MYTYLYVYVSTCVFNFYLHNTHTEGTACIIESKVIFCARTDCTIATSTFRMHTVEIILQPNGRCLFFNTQAIYKMLNLNTVASYDINNMKKMLFHFCLILHSSKEQQIPSPLGHKVCGLPFKFLYWHLL